VQIPKAPSVGYSSKEFDVLNDLRVDGGYAVRPKDKMTLLLGYLMGILRSR
jgi:hypothetical protein